MQIQCVSDDRKFLISVPMMKFIPETRGVHPILYLQLYYFHWMDISLTMRK